MALKPYTLATRTIYVDGSPYLNVVDNGDEGVLLYGDQVEGNKGIHISLKTDTLCLELNNAHQGMLKDGEYGGANIPFEEEPYIQIKDYDDGIFVMGPFGKPAIHVSLAIPELIKAILATVKENEG